MISALLFDVGETILQADATAVQVVRLMSAESTALLAVASAISWPVSYWTLQLWLESFAYRIELTAWPFLAATACVMTLALLVVVSRSAGTAQRSPVHSLRYERDAEELPARRHTKPEDIAMWKSNLTVALA